MSTYNRSRRNPRPSKRSPGRPLPDKARASYNFVPANTQVVFPDDKTQAQNVSWDIPFRDAVSGSLDIRITLKTPGFVRDSEHLQSFFQLPNNKYGIPGTSIRGMLRTVTEIATFGKLQRVNTKHTYGVRDLHNRELYGSHMAEIINKNPTPLVSAGWLTIKEGEDTYEDSHPVWQIQPCNFAKVEYGLLEQWAEALGIEGYNPNKKQSAPEKYLFWHDEQRKVSARVKVRRRHEAKKSRKTPWIGNYGEVNRSLERRGETGPSWFDGTLVFTGQPQDYDPRQKKRKGAGNPKHHDFFFYEEQGEPIDVPFEVRQAFSFVHSNRGEQHRLDAAPNPEWEFWKSRLEKGQRVPVFFLLEPGSSVNQPKLRAFGLAMMFRLAYRHGIREAVEYTQPEAFVEQPDFAELLYGRVETSSYKGRYSYKGRISIETAVVQGDPQPQRPVTTVLGSPKASYYPNYIEQGKMYGEHPHRRTQKGKAEYYTFMEDHIRIRGWKRYPRRKREGTAPPPPVSSSGMINENVTTTFSPLPAGTSFTTRIHVHNLRPFELGALLWSLDFGGRKDCWHSIGMGRPLGYGGVTIELRNRPKLYQHSVNPETKRIERQDYNALDNAVKAFTKFMNEQLEGWENSPQLKELIALATPVEESQARDLRHMQISHPDFRNEFQGVKQAGFALKRITAGTPLTAQEQEFYQADRDAYQERRAAAKEKRKREEAHLERTEPATSPKSPKKTDVPPVQQKRSPEPPPGPSPEELRRRALRKEIDAELDQAAKKKDIILAWMNDTNSTMELTDIRRQAARALWPSPNKKWRQKNRELWNWVKSNE